MANQRQYEPWTMCNVRIVDIRHLWEPSHEYKGRRQEKPSWFSAFIVPKTGADWRYEPALAPIAQACQKLWQNNPQVNRFPVTDGDLPNAEGKSSDWAKGHWIFSGSTSNMPNIEIAQPGGALAKLTSRSLMLPGGQTMQVKTGDFVMVGGTCAVAQNEATRIKSYLNAVVFTAAGPEIVFANQVTGADLMRTAQAQGLQVSGYGPAPGSAPAGGAPGGWGGPQQGGFTPPAGGFAPNPGQGFPGGPANGQGAPGHGGMGGVGVVTSPSNGQPQQWGAPQQQAPFGSAGPGTPAYGAPGGMPANGGAFPSNNGPTAPNTAYPSSGQQWGSPSPAPTGWPQQH